MRVHSLESFGTVDGPGVRFIIFTQGCPLRCLYCHNPDTWDSKGQARQMSPQELFSEVSKYRAYIAKGGVTVSGGEPLLQASEVRELFELCQKDGLHTALDTSGAILNDEVKELLKVTNLVLLDIKSIDVERNHKVSGGGSLDRTIAFLDYLQSNGIATWVRHVVVKGYTDNDNDLDALAKFIEKYSVVERVEILPYHRLGVSKYEALGIDYPLLGVEELEDERIEEIKAKFTHLQK